MIEAASAAWLTEAFGMWIDLLILFGIFCGAVVIGVLAAALLIGR